MKLTSSKAKVIFILPVAFWSKVNADTILGTDLSFPVTVLLFSALSLTSSSICKRKP